MRKVELKQLEYFLAVAENLSFTKAAEEIHVAQPAISQQIKYLEFVLGLPLFHRDNKRVVLTEAGELLRKHAVDVLNSVDRAVRVIEELRGLERGTVSIGMSSTVATILMADLVREFRQQFPDIKVRITESMTTESVQRLKNGELDLAVVTLPLEEDNALVVETLYDEDLEVMIPHKHPLAQSGQTEVTLGELNRYQWILANPSNGLRRLINQACSLKGFCPIVPIEVDRISAVKNLLLYSDEGVTILPPTAVLSELSLGLLRRLKIKDCRIFRSVGLASRLRHLLPPATIEMIGVIKQICFRYPERSFLAHSMDEFAARPLNGSISTSLNGENHTAIVSSL